MNRKRVTIDAGHGGHDSGAMGPNGLRESDVTLSVAMLLGAMLATEFEVYYTRRDDTFVALGTRATMCNDANADAFLSIHCNAGPPGQGTGYEVFTTPGLTASDGFATDLFLAWGAEFPHASKRLDMTDGDVDKEAAFAVLRLTHCRAALFELDFIHTAAGEAMLGDRTWQMAAARALAAGVRKHFAIEESKVGKSKVEESKIEESKVEGRRVEESKVEEREEEVAAVRERLLEISAEMLTLHNKLA
jgi:N-acetylmuramoyl-L-alanine amidase